jgi:hypothetical protein
LNLPGIITFFLTLTSMFDIPLKEILAQLKRDLIGKDSHRGVTLTYAWLANQFGHIALGFIPSFVVYLLLNRYAQWERPAFLAAVIISSVWLLFEIYNFLAPLLSKRSPKAQSVFLGGRKYTFKPRWGFIAFDTSTDVLFFILGSFACASLINPVFWWNIFIVILVQIILLYPMVYWFTSKVYLMNAGFPMQFRLSQWDRSITPTDVQDVSDFISSEAPQHLLLFGSRGSGKSSLAVGIACDLTTQTNRKKCTYDTGIKLFPRFFQESDAFDSPFLWNWSDCDCLVVDDINPGLPMTIDLVSPSAFLAFVEHDTFGERNKEILNSRKVIWVMGEILTGTKEHINNWQSVLRTLGVDENNIVVVDLTDA